MSSPSQPSGSASNGATCVSASSANALAATTSVGSTTGNESGFSSRSSSAIFPPTSTSSARPPRFFSTPSLSSTLAPPVTSTNGPLDVAEQPAEVLELGEQEQPGVGGQQLRDADRRGMRAVRRAEGVVDEEVAALGQLTRELGIVRRLAGVEARVLEHLDPLVRQERAQPLAHRLDPERGILALRPAEVRADADAGRAALEQQLERRQRRPDARVVGDPPVLERDVQVGADEDGLAVDVRVADRARQPHSCCGSDWKSSIRFPEGSRR